MLKPEHRHTNEDFENLANERIDTAVRKMGLFQDVVKGRLSRPQLRSAAQRYYAEVRTFVDLKLPERLRLCPSDALRARRFLAEIYAEEHGNFEPGRDHPALWARFCHALGIGERELEDEYRSYSARFRYLREREPSRENLVTELATMAAWESVVPRLARLPIQSLREAY
ncbi:MAG: iron-containing redox enzyme family protein, partial [Myxococcota bacterium]